MNLDSRWNIFTYVSRRFLIFFVPLISLARIHGGLKLHEIDAFIRDGHRYPCPALVIHGGSHYVSRAAAPEGTEGDKVLWNTGGICTSRPSIRLSIQEAWISLKGASAGGNGCIDGRTDGTCRFPLYSTGLYSLRGRCPKRRERKKSRKK